MTESDVIDLVRSEVARAGSMRELSRQWNVSCAYVSDIVGGRRSLGPAILNHLGLERRVTVDYVKIQKNGKSKEKPFDIRRQVY